MIDLFLILIPPFWEREAIVKKTRYWVASNTYNTKLTTRNENRVKKEEEKEKRESGKDEGRRGRAGERRRRKKKKKCLLLIFCTRKRKASFVQICYLCFGL